jgi:hypothetical protein
MLTPKEYVFWPSELEPVWGFLLCFDGDGNHVTLRGDPDLVRMVREALEHVVADLEVGGQWERRAGWPEDWQEEDDA